MQAGKGVIAVNHANRSEAKNPGNVIVAGALLIVRGSHSGSSGADRHQLVLTRLEMRFLFRQKLLERYWIDGN